MFFLTSQTRFPVRSLFDPSLLQLSRNCERDCFVSLTSPNFAETAKLTRRSSLSFRPMTKQIHKEHVFWFLNCPRFCDLVIVICEQSLWLWFSHCDFVMSFVTVLTFNHKLLTKRSQFNHNSLTHIGALDRSHKPSLDGGSDQRAYELWEIQFMFAWCAARARPSRAMAVVRRGAAMDHGSLQLTTNSK